MAIFRKVHVHFWTDAWVIDLTPEKKYFYLYLLTNDKVHQCGIYEISLRKMEFETGYTKETILQLLNEFKKLKKVRYNIKTNEICLINFSKYNFTTKGTVVTCIRNGLKEVKDKKLIEYLYSSHALYREHIDGINTTSQEEKEEEKEEEKYKEIVTHYSSEIDTVLNSWGFADRIEKRMLLINHLYELQKFNVSLDDFFTQSKYYIQYKKMVKGERKHTFNNYLGTKNPADLNSPGWNCENWEHKYNSLKRDNNDQDSKAYELGL